MKFDKHILISELNTKVYFSKSISLFRHYQNLFLEKFSAQLTGNIVELGGEIQYDHKRFFRHAQSFTCSNIGRDHEYYLDMTNMKLENNSQDSYICISVLEHVFEIRNAFAEIERTLKPGGKLLITIPFAYPYHDEVDYWRLSTDSYYELLKNFEIVSFVHLGGLFSSIADNLKRPKEKWNIRYTVYKIIGFLVLLVGRRLERKDGFPLGYGIYCIKK
jgi:SAM-dependent methyltransferase